MRRGRIPRRKLEEGRKILPKWLRENPGRKKV